MSEVKTRDRWDKVGVFVQPLGGLFTTDARLYSELMSQREQAESNLRKDMLVSVIQSYLAPEAGSIGAKLLHLELLAYNFHDSLDLKPLFVDLTRQIEMTKDKDRTYYAHRLRQVGREIADRQRFALELRGDSFRRTVDLAELAAAGAGGVALDPATLDVDGSSSEVSLRVLRADREAEELLVRLEVSSDAIPEVTRAEFEVGYFDFPMIDSTRLSNGQRCAVMLGAFGDETADLTTVCFPGEYASLKDRPYYDEVMRQLRREEPSKAK
jgi:hypothetical protein